MAQYNSVVEIPSVDANALFAALESAFPGSGVIDTENYTFWFDTDKSVGFQLNKNNVTSGCLISKNGAQTQQVSVFIDNVATLTWNSESTSGVFMFGFEGSLQFIVCKDTEGSTVALWGGSSSGDTAFWLVTDTGKYTLDLEPAFENSDASGIALAPLPAFVKATQLQNVYYVISKPTGITWSPDSAVYCNGALYKLSYAGPTNAAVACKI